METTRQQLPFISILVLSYNQQDFIADCIDSVLSQQYDGKLEIIFCDDCSSDSTFDIIQQKVAVYKGAHRVVAHRCATNGKVAVNMNVAVSLSHGDWLMRVDGDDILHPDRTRLTALAIMKYPMAAAISGTLVTFTNTPTRITNPPDENLDFLVATQADFSAGKKPQGVEWWGGMMTFTRRLFTHFGDLPAICNVLDDTMFATRALMLGQFVIIRNGILLYYRRHSGNISSDSQQCSQQSIRQIMQADAATRDYYRRGLPCHEPILDELKQHTATHPESQGLLEHFQTHFANLRRHALYWEKSWRQRVQDAHIQGTVLKKLPHALCVLCPLTYAISCRLKQMWGKRSSAQ